MNFKNFDEFKLNEYEDPREIHKNSMNHDIEEFAKKYNLTEGDLESIGKLLRSIEAENKNGSIDELEEAVIEAMSFLMEKYLKNK